MKESSGADAADSRHAKTLTAGKGKVGKSFFDIASLLGLFPWQEEGGVVDKPSHLHVIGIDYGAITGVKASLKKLLNAPDEALNFRYYSLQEDFKATFTRSTHWDYTFYNQCLQALAAVRANWQKAPGGVHALLISSITTLQSGLERGLSGAPDASRKGSGMDESKWQALYGQVNEFRNYAQVDDWHCLWEAHIDEVPASMRSDEGPKEKLQLKGLAGRDFANNVEQIFMVRRNFGQPHKGTRVDEMYFDTRPTMGFIAGGRATTENLKAQEPDMTKAFRKLGLRVGGWKPGVKKKKEL
jgi:hypothetical protein